MPNICQVIFSKNNKTTYSYVNYRLCLRYAILHFGLLPYNMYMHHRERLAHTNRPLHCISFSAIELRQYEINKPIRQGSCQHTEQAIAQSARIQRLWAFLFGDTICASGEGLGAHAVLLITLHCLNGAFERGVHIRAACRFGACGGKARLYIARHERGDLFVQGFFSVMPSSFVVETWT